MSEVIVLTAEELKFFPFFPPAVGGIVPPEHVQISLEAKGLVLLHTDGLRWVTIIGDRARRGSLPIRIEG